ncbi:MAG: aminotransferase class V-fold PLP-dependent enzyme [Phycisphaerales bacterium]|nr:aminotransferase class V-fold PLP-dependent enzyme [Phycisphaerales bacterium]
MNQTPTSVFAAQPKSGLSADRPRPIIEFVDARISEPARFPIQHGLIQLNNGSYGSAPEVVLAAHRELQRRLELDPVRFFKSDLEYYADDTRDALSSFVNAPAEDLALVCNATVAVSTVLQNLELSPGDEIIVTDHEYMATVNELGRICKQTGAKIVTAKIPFPRVTSEIVIQSVMDAITGKTKLVLISHIASASALVFPVEEIVPLVKAKGIDIFVDGAHVPGQIDLDLKALDPTWYAASCHKWLATPKGTGFIYTNPDRQRGFEPLALSCRVHEKRADRKAFLCDFDYMGTNDYSANLAIPVSIAHMGAQLPGGWDALRKRNHDLAVEGARIVCDAIGIEQQVPESMIGTMVAIPLPGEPKDGTLYDNELWDRLYLNHAIQVPVWELPGIHPRVMRIGAQLYNTIEDFEKLGAALKDELNP